MKQKSKWITPLILVVLVAMIVTVVLAAYLKNSNEVVNNFKPAVSTIPEVSEKFEENDRKLKEDVRFNVGETEYPVYVRAKIVITWQTEDDGLVYYKPVEDDDYELILSDNGAWEFNIDDGFYYCKEVINSGQYTPVLIDKCRQLKDAPAEGYTLSVEIIVQTVQAIGTTDAETYEDGTPAYQDAWDLYDEKEETTEETTNLN